MVKSRPHVILSAAISLDGKLATKNGDSKLSSMNDKTRVHKLRATVDAILVGRNTVQRDDPLLSVRHTKGKNPTRIILDSKCTIFGVVSIITTWDSRGPGSRPIIFFMFISFFLVVWVKIKPIVVRYSFG